MSKIGGRAVRAEVIMCPGTVDPAGEYAVLELNVAGVETPYHFVLQMPVVGYKALLESGVDPVDLYKYMARKVNMEDRRAELAAGLPQVTD